ncbi:MAG: translation elongation factor Ts [Planctomycetes bacterium]|nr:translation elongation factor Ts [Planctomycetota bacterium]MBI3844332.1 translation elongation factor Ts [Planctomycetota bacterium]
MEISAALVKQLRDLTGAGIVDCRTALQQAEGHIGNAVEVLRKKGAASAEKKATRSAKEGLVASYIHFTGKVGVLVEVNCETDFVARNDEFKALVKDLTLHIAAFRPSYLKREDVATDVVDKELEIYRELCKKEGKPEAAWPKIIEGRLEKYYADRCLLEQPWVHEQSKPVKQVVQEMIARIGENIVVKRFTRYEIGEE